MLPTNQPQLNLCFLWHAGTDGLSLNEQNTWSEEERKVHGSMDFESFDRLHRELTDDRILQNFDKRELWYFEHHRVGCDVTYTLSDPRNEGVETFSVERWDMLCSLYDKICWLTSRRDVQATRRPGTLFVVTSITILKASTANAEGEFQSYQSLEDAERDRNRASRRIKRTPRSSMLHVVVGELRESRYRDEAKKNLKNRVYATVSILRARKVRFYYEGTTLDGKLQLPVPHFGPGRRIRPKQIRFLEEFRALSTLSPTKICEWFSMKLADGTLDMHTTLATSRLEPVASRQPVGEMTRSGSVDSDKCILTISDDSDDDWDEHETQDFSNKEDEDLFETMNAIVDDVMHTTTTMSGRSFSSPNETPCAPVMVPLSLRYLSDPGLDLRLRTFELECNPTNSISHIASHAVPAALDDFFKLNPRVSRQHTRTDVRVTTEIKQHCDAYDATIEDAGQYTMQEWSDNGRFRVGFDVLLWKTEIYS